MTAKTMIFRAESGIKKNSFFRGFSVVVWPNQGVQLKDRLF